MKKISIILLVICTIFYSCDKKNTNEESSESPAIKILETNQNLSSFTQALKDNDIDITESNVTILAIENSIYDQLKSANSTFNEKEILENHIIKGSFPSEQLAYGLRLETIGGNSITVGKENEKIYFNNIELLTGDNKTSEIIIHYVSGTIEITNPKTASDANTELSKCYNSFEQYIKYWYLFDGVITDESGAPSSDWNSIDQHTYTMTDNKVEILWFDAYNLIFDINELLSKTDAIIADTEEKNNMVGQLRGMRGILYFILNLHFGRDSYGVILYSSVDNHFKLNPRASFQETIDLIITDLNAASAMLPLTSTSQLTKSAADAYIAKAYMLSKDFQNVKQSCSSIINSGNYQLEADVNQIFANQTNSESLYSFEKAGYSEFEAFFQKGNYVPLSRYTDVLLLYIKSTIELGIHDQSLNTINQILARKGDVPVQLPIEETFLIDLWVDEMNNEGRKYFILKLFNKLQDVQIDIIKEALPIPLTVLNFNPYVSQNAGY